MQDIYHALGRIESQSQALHISIHTIQKIVGRLEKRISMIERQYYFWRGGIGLLLFLSTLFSSFMEKIIGYMMKGV